MSDEPQAQEAPIPLGELALSQAAETPQSLDVLPDPDEKPKGKPKAKPRLDIPSPQTPREWRLVVLAGVIVSVVAAAVFLIAPVRTVTVIVPAPAQPSFLPSPFPTDTLAFWDWSMPLVANMPLLPAADQLASIQFGQIVLIAAIGYGPDGTPLYTVHDRDGYVNNAFAYQLEPLAGAPTPLAPDFQPQPRFYPGQRVHVGNLDETLRSLPDWWWVKRQQFLPEQREWIYEVQTDGGITLMRSEAQLTALATPTPLPLPTPTLNVRPT